MKFLKAKIHKRKKETDKWTYKVGSAIGKKIDIIFAKKHCKQITIIAVLAVLFIFIVPIQNNIITVSVLIALLIISFLINKNGKKK